MANSENAWSHPELKRRHVAAATIGNALEFYDFLTYSFFSIQIGHAFFPTQSAYGSLMLSLATFGAGFVTRPIGAIVIGLYADRVGRRPAMLLCFVLIGCSILAMALIPPYATIGLAAPILAVLARMVQGFSLGGEIGSNTAFLSESAPPNQRGLIVSWQGASQLAAIVTGGLVGVLLTTLLPPDLLDAYGWRIAFLLGATVVPFGLWMRTSLPETLNLISEEELSPTPDEPRLAQARKHWQVIVLGMVVLSAGTISSYIFTYAVTYAQTTLHLPAQVGFVAETSGILMGIPAVLLGGWLSDRFGRWPINVVGNGLFLALIYPMFAWIVAARSELALVVSMIVLGGAGNLTLGSLIAGLTESLPRSIRSSSFGTLYSVSIAAFGGTAQLMVTWLIHVTGSAMAPAWYMIVTGVFGQVAFILIPESAPVRKSPKRSSDLQTA